MRFTSFWSHLRYRYKILSFALGCCWLVNPAGAAEKLSPDLALVPPHDTVQVLVRFRTHPDAATLRWLSGRGAVHHQHLELIESSLMSVRGGDLSLLATDPSVESITLDRPLQATAFSSTADYGWLGVLGLTDPTASFSLTGQGIGVAVVDSGISPHADLVDRSGKSLVVYSQSFVPGDPATTDSYGHGTHVAGILAGTGASSTGKHERT